MKSRLSKYDQYILNNRVNCFTDSLFYRYSAADCHFHKFDW